MLTTSYSHRKNSHLRTRSAIEGLIGRYPPIPLTIGHIVHIQYTMYPEAHTWRHHAQPTLNSIPLAMFSSLTETLEAIKGWQNEINGVSWPPIRHSAVVVTGVMNGPTKPAACCVRDVEIQMQSACHKHTEVTLYLRVRTKTKYSHH